jgi:hypothetical protein
MKHIDLSPFRGRHLSSADWQHLIFRILFTPRDDYLPFAESIIQKAERQRGLNPEASDPLLALLGFTKETLPRPSHTFNAEMGHLFESIVRIALKISSETLYEDDFSVALSNLPESDRLNFKKTTADCIFNESAIEIKYRYGSKEGLTQQKRAAQPLKRMGLKPVMLCFRHSPNAQSIRAGGLWSVYEGQDSIDYIHRHTGYDLGKILHDASLNPMIIKRIKDLQDTYSDRTRARLGSDYQWAPEGHRAPVHRLIADDEEVRSEFLSDIGFEDDVLKGFLDHIIRDPSILNDPEIAPLVAEVNNKQQLTSQTLHEAY